MKKPPKISILFLLHMIWIAQVRTQDTNHRCAVRIQVIREIADSVNETTTRMSTFITTSAAITATFPDEDHNDFTEISFEFAPISTDEPTDLTENVIRVYGEFVTYQRKPKQVQHESNNIDDMDIDDSDDMQTGFVLLIIVLKKLRANAVINPVKRQIEDDFEEYDVNDVFFYRVTDEPYALTYTKVYPSDGFVPDVDVLGAGLYYETVDETKPYLFMGLYTSHRPTVDHVTETLHNRDILQYWEECIEYHSIPPNPSGVVPFLKNHKNTSVRKAFFFSTNFALTMDLRTRTLDEITFHFNVAVPGAPNVTFVAKNLGLHELLGNDDLFIMVLPYYPHAPRYVRPVAITDKPMTSYSPNSFYTYQLLPEKLPHIHLISDYVYMRNPADPESFARFVNLEFHGKYIGGVFFSKNENGSPVMIGLVEALSDEDVHEFRPAYLQDYYAQIRLFAIVANRHSEEMQQIARTFRKFLEDDPHDLNVDEIDHIIRVFEPIALRSVQPHNDVAEHLANLLARWREVKLLLEMGHPIGVELKRKILDVYENLRKRYPISFRYRQASGQIIHV